MVDMGEAIRNGFRNYFNFSGRSTRAEYWWWTAFVILASIAATALDNLIFKTSPITNIKELIDSAVVYPSSPAGNPAGPILLTVTLLLFIPSVMLIFRRLRDVGRWWFWIILVIIPFGAILLLIFEVSPTAKSGWGEPTSPKNPSLIGSHLSKD